MATPLSKIRLLCIVQVSSQVGTGHLMRCLALSQVADEQDIETLFLLDEAGFRLAQGVTQTRSDWVGTLLSLGQSPSDHVEVLNAVVGQAPSNMIILDGLKFSGEIYEGIRAASTPVIVFDDGVQTHAVHPDILVNPAGGHLEQHYCALYPKARLCLGAEYRLLRLEFSRKSVLPMCEREGIVVNFGGSDPLGLTLFMLNALVEIGFDGFVRVVTGAAFQMDNLIGLEAATRLNALLADMPLNVEHLHNCTSMQPIWSKAKLAVSAAGGSQFELAACSTPAFLIVVAENQRRAAEQAGQEGWCEIIDATRYEKNYQQITLDVAKRVKKMFSKTACLADRSVKASVSAVCNGAENLLKVMTSEIL